MNRSERLDMIDKLRAENDAMAIEQAAREVRRLNGLEDWPDEPIITRELLTPAFDPDESIHDQLHQQQINKSYAHSTSAAPQQQRQLSPLDRKLRRIIKGVATNVARIVRAERNRVDAEIAKLRIELLQKAGEDSSFIKNELTGLRSDLTKTRSFERDEIMDLDIVTPYTRRRRDVKQ